MEVVSGFVSDVGVSRMRRATRPRSKRSRAGRSREGKSTWRVMRRCRWEEGTRERALVVGGTGSFSFGDEGWASSVLMGAVVVVEVVGLVGEASG